MLARRGKPFVVCPRCGSLPRHRAIWQAMQETVHGEPDWRVLLVAPEDALLLRLKRQYHRVETLDLNRRDVDHRCDLRSLPMSDGLFDLTICIHVLEHIPKDIDAIWEMYRTLKPGGTAVIAVPINAPYTVEYPEPCEAESGHVRCCGVDYYDRLRQFFPVVEVVTTGDPTLQPYDYEDRRHPTNPLRPTMDEARYPNPVAICRK